MQSENLPLIVQTCSPPPLTTSTNNPPPEHSSAHYNSIGSFAAPNMDAECAEETDALSAAAPSADSPAQDFNHTFRLPSPPQHPPPLPFPFPPFALPFPPSISLPPLALPPSLTLPLPAHAHIHTQTFDFLPPLPQALLRAHFHSTPGPLDGVGHSNLQPRKPSPPFNSQRNAINEPPPTLMQTTAPVDFVQRVLSLQFDELLRAAAAGTLATRQSVKANEPPPTARKSCATGPMPPAAHAGSGQQRAQQTSSGASFCSRSYDTNESESYVNFSVDMIAWTSQRYVDLVWFYCSS